MKAIVSKAYAHKFSDALMLLPSRDHKPSNRPTWTAILDVLQSPDADKLLQVDENPSRALKLPPESLKLGSSDLNSAKNLHKDLQIKYTELQVS